MSFSMDVEEGQHETLAEGKVDGQGEALFKTAKQLDHISGPIQEIKFAPEFHANSYRFLEVDRGLAESLMSGEEQLVIRGGATDLVVACSRHKSYQVKEVETSNVFLLATNSASQSSVTGKGGEGIEVVCQTGTYLEMVEVVQPASATRQHLRDMLSRHQLNSFEKATQLGDLEGESTVKSEGLNRQRLLNEVQLSELELDAELGQLPVVISGDGGLLLLSEEYRKQLVEAVVELCDDPTQPDIECNRLNLDSLKAAFDTGEAHQGEAIRQWFLPKLCHANSDGTYALTASALYRERLAYLLNPTRATKDIPFGQLEKAVELLIPMGLSDCGGLKREYLRGLALVEENIVTGLMVRPISVNDLPLEADRRFERLFAVRLAWRKEEIEPYLVDLCATQGRVEELLLKFCKVVRKGDERFFSRRQPS